MDRYVWSEDGMIVDTTKPWHDPDQDPATATDEPLYEEIDETVDLLNDQNAEITALRSELDAKDAEIERLEGECKRLRGDRRDALRALVYACHSGGMALNEYVPACLLDEGMGGTLPNPPCGKESTMPDLTREEVERRLEMSQYDTGQRRTHLLFGLIEALHTAQSLYAKLDAQTERHKAEIAKCLRAMDKLEAERDALAAEVKRLEAVAEAGEKALPEWDRNTDGCNTFKAALAAWREAQ